MRLLIKFLIYKIIENKELVGVVYGENYENAKTEIFDEIRSELSVMPMANGGNVSVLDSGFSDNKEITGKRKTFDHYVTGIIYPKYAAHNELLILEL